MKLKTKVISITTVIIFLALVLSNILIQIMTKNVLIKEAINKEKYTVASIFNDFRNNCGTNDYTNKQAIQYYLKGQRNDYIVCFSTEPNQTDEYYNRTIYSIEDITSAELKSNKSSEKYINYFVLDKKRNIYAFSCDNLAGIKLYYLSDFNDVYGRLNFLKIAAIITSLIILVISVTVLLCILKLSFKPLSLLSKKANLIATGNYRERIEIKSKDEIGNLSDDFNKMATAIEIHNNMIETEAEKRLLFMANLTHELKTPLTAIQGYSETMLASRMSEEDQTTALLYIFNECKRLNRLSKKMLYILELEKNEAINLHDVSISNLFHSVYDSCIFSAQQKSVTIKIIPTDLVLHTDTDLMTDVLINLCDNAIKALDENGEVRLYTVGSKITIEDFGSGIPEDEINKLTEPFYRVDKSRSRQNGGSGLGLYLTSLIIDKLDMKLEIQSKVGKGTKMTIYNSFKT